LDHTWDEWGALLIRQIFDQPVDIVLRFPFMFRPERAVLLDPGEPECPAIVGILPDGQKARLGEMPRCRKLKLFL